MQPIQSEDILKIVQSLMKHDGNMISVSLISLKLLSILQTHEYRMSEELIATVCEGNNERVLELLEEHLI